MKLSEMKTIHDFETGLKIGKKIQVRWTASHHYFVGFGRVEKLNQNSVRVTLTENIEGYPNAEGYPKGQIIRVPLLTSGTSLKAWSPNNRVEPVGGY